MNGKIVAAIIVVVCIGNALAKQGAKSHSSPKSILGPNSSSSSGSGSSHKRGKWCDAAPLFKKEDHCEHCCTDECGTCEMREKFETQKQYKWQCRIVKCTRPCDPSNGYVDIDKTCLGATARYYCDDDFFISGTGNRTCQADGTWSVPEPTCIPVVRCPPLCDPSNGHVNQSDNLVGSVAMYECGPDFVLSGSVKRICQSDGTWSNAEPVCDPIVTCPSPCPPTDGYVQVKPHYESLPKVGSLALYYCNHGFTRYGDNIKRCSENGTWVPILPLICHPERNCGNKWYMVYENDENGNRLYGELVNLNNAIRKGADARVRFPLHNVVAPLQNGVIELYRGVCGQIIFNWKKDGYDRFSESAVWQFKMVCTLQVEDLYINYGENVTLERIRPKLHTQWFVRERCNNKPILTVTSDGSIEAGSVSSVIGAVKLGQDIQATIGFGYAVSVDNIEYNDLEDEFTAMDVWRITKTPTLAARIYVFTVNPLWRLALHSSSGMMRESRWQIGDHIFDGNYSDQRYSVNWYTNLCWDEVYKNDENGIALNGYDIESLRGKASKGHRIKLMYNRTLIECTEVLLKGDHVCCTCFNKLSKSAIDEFPSDVNHIAEIVCTNGMINRLITEIGSNNVVNGTLEEHASVSWFADVRRSWRNVVSIDPTGGVISGSKQVLIDVVEGGAAIRYKVQFGPQYFAIFEPDHIEIDGENLGAMFIRSIGMRFDNDFVFKYIQERPYLSAHIMTTIGKMDKSKWTLGEHEPRGHEVEFHKADWFVNN